MILHLDFAQLSEPTSQRFTVAAKAFFILHRTGTDDDLFNVIQTLDSDGFVFAVARNSKKEKILLHCNCFVSLSDFFDHLHSFYGMEKKWFFSLRNPFPVAGAFNSLQRMPHILCNSFFFSLISFSTTTPPTHPPSLDHAALFNSAETKILESKVKWNLLFWVPKFNWNWKNRLAVKCVWFNPFGLVFDSNEKEGNKIQRNNLPRVTSGCAQMFISNSLSVCYVVEVERQFKC